MISAYDPRLIDINTFNHVAKFITFDKNDTPSDIERKASERKNQILTWLKNESEKKIDRSRLMKRAHAILKAKGITFTNSFGMPEHISVNNFSEALKQAHKEIREWKERLNITLIFETQN